MEWASSNHTPSKEVVERNLYKPYREGYSILPYPRRPGKFYALRGRGQNGVKKAGLFYSVEEARTWLDNLPEKPTLELVSNSKYFSKYDVECLKA